MTETASCLVRVSPMVRNQIVAIFSGRSVQPAASSDVLIASGKRNGETAKTRSSFRAVGVDGEKARARNQVASELEFRTIDVNRSRRGSQFT